MTGIRVARAAQMYGTGSAAAVELPPLAVGLPAQLHSELGKGK